MFRFSVGGGGAADVAALRLMPQHLTLSTSLVEIRFLPPHEPPQLTISLAQKSYPEPCPQSLQRVLLVSPFKLLSNPEPRRQCQDDLHSTL